VFDLAGKVALVAGGAGYLGFPACRGLIAHGARVMIADVNAEKINLAVKTLSVDGGWTAW